jgi:hypothetical protein
MKKPKVHPVAELFPMMSDEELDDLADDIKANGLLHPIVLDESGMLIDGRNRFEACKRAGLEPECETLNGQDPVAFIWSQNDKRRHMKLGQRAMVAAKMRILNIQSTRAAAKQTGVAQSYVAHASIVLQYLPDLADAIIQGDLALNEAYEKALIFKKDAESDEGKMQRLRKGAPDLADQVAEEQLTLAEALGAMKARQDEKRQEEESLRQERILLAQSLDAALRLLNPAPSQAKERANYLLETIDFGRVDVPITKEFLKECSQVLTVMSQKWKEDGDGTKQV